MGREEDVLRWQALAEDRAPCGEVEVEVRLHVFTQAPSDEEDRYGEDEEVSGPAGHAHTIIDVGLGLWLAVASRKDSRPRSA